VCATALPTRACSHRPVAKASGEQAASTTGSTALSPVGSVTLTRAMPASPARCVSTAVSGTESPTRYRRPRAPTYSRSRGRLALKGESSRHFQHVREFWTDCDRDVVLFKVEQDVAACHEGYRSCFYRKHEGGEWRTTGERAFDPEAVYHGAKK